MKRAKRCQALGPFPRTSAGVPTTGVSVATTYRRAAAAFQRGKENLFRSSAESRPNSSSNNLSRQGASSTDLLSSLEIVVPLLVTTAKTAVAPHARSQGSTVSVAEGNLLGRSGFAVSIYPEISIELTGPPTLDLLFAFAILNAALLLRPDHALGTWFDRKRNRHVLDVVVCPESLDTAIRLGINCGQQAIFDLKEGREISLVSVPEVHAVEVRRGEN